MASNDVTTNAYFTMMPSDLPACSNMMQGERLRAARGALSELLENYSSIRLHISVEQSSCSVLNVMLSKSGRTILQHDPDAASGMYDMLRNSLLDKMGVPTSMLPEISLQVADAGMVSVEEQNTHHQAERARTVAVKDQHTALYIGLAEGRGSRAPALTVSVPGLCRSGEESPKLVLTRIGYTSVELSVHCLDGSVEALPNDSLEDVNTDLLDALFMVALPETKALKSKPLGHGRSNVHEQLQFAWLRLMADVLRLQTFGTATSPDPLPSMRPFAVDQLQAFTTWDPMQISQRGIRYVARMNPAFGTSICALNPRREEVASLRGNSRIYVDCGCCGEPLIEDDDEHGDVVHRCPVHGAHYDKTCQNEGFNVCGSQPYLRVYACHDPVQTPGGPLAVFGETVSDEPLRVIGVPRSGSRDSDKKVDAWARTTQHPFLKQMFGAFMGASSVYMHAKRDEHLAQLRAEESTARQRACQVIEQYRDKEAELLDQMTSHCETTNTASLDQQDVDVANMLRTTKFTASIPRSKSDDKKVQIYDASGGDQGPLGESRAAKKRKLVACKEYYSQNFLPHSSGWTTDPHDRPSGAPAAREVERRRRRGVPVRRRGADSDEEF